jgi:hypothetical protein
VAVLIIIEFLFRRWTFNIRVKTTNTIHYENHLSNLHVPCFRFSNIIFLLAACLKPSTTAVFCPNNAYSDNRNLLLLIFWTGSVLSLSFSLLNCSARQLLKIGIDLVPLNRLHRCSKDQFLQLLRSPLDHSASWHLSVSFVISAYTLCSVIARMSGFCLILENYLYWKKNEHATFFSHIDIGSPIFIYCVVLDIFFQRASSTVIAWTMFWTDHLASHWETVYSVT